MHEHIQSVDVDIWDVVVNGQFQSQIHVDGDDGVLLDKLKVDWTTDDKMKSNTI